MRAIPGDPQGRSLVVPGPRHRVKGFTIVELLVGATLLMVLMTMVYQVLAPSMRQVKKAEADTETQQAVLVALDRVFVSLRLSDSRSVTILAEPPAIAFLSPRPPTTPALPPLAPTMYGLAGADMTPVVWRSFEVLYHDAARGLLLGKQAPYSGLGEVARMTPPQVQAFLADLRYPARPVARNLKVVQFSRPRPPAVLIDVTSVVAAADKARETRLRLQVAPRN